MPDQPMQPIVVADDGRVRFHPNKIIKYLLTTGKLQLNELAQLQVFSNDDWMQVTQQLGYSVSGFGDLSFADPNVVAAADAIAAELLKRRTDPPIQEADPVSQFSAGPAPKPNYRRTQDQIFQVMMDSPKPYREETPTDPAEVTAMAVLATLIHADDLFGKAFGILDEEASLGDNRCADLLTDVAAVIRKSDVATNMQKPDLFICATGPVGVYTNHPAALGDMVLAHPTPTGAFTDITPQRLTGDATQWREELKTGSQRVAEMLEKFTYTD